MQQTIKGKRIAVSGEPIPLRLKQQLLLFDQVAIIDLAQAILFSRWMGEGLSRPEFADAANDIEFCVEQGLVFDGGETAFNESATVNLTGAELADWQRIPSIVELRRDTARPMWQAMNHVREGKTPSLEEVGKSFFDFTAVHAEYHRVASRVIAQQLRNTLQIEASAISDEQITLHIPEMSSAAESVNVVDIVLSQIPLPDESVSWERIIEFRKDPDTKGFLQGLRVWMADIQSSTCSTVEASEKLEWLLYQRSAHLKAHKMAANLGMFGATFVASMEILENIAKLKLGAAAKAVVAFTNREAELLKLETSGPGLEVSYILKAKQSFGGG